MHAWLATGKLSCRLSGNIKQVICHSSFKVSPVCARPMACPALAAPIMEDSRKQAYSDVGAHPDMVNGMGLLTPNV